MSPILSNLMLAIDTQLKIQGYHHDCHCPSCNTLKPLAYALKAAQKELEEEALRVFCAGTQAPQCAETGTGQVAEGSGPLANPS